MMGIIAARFVIPVIEYSKYPSVCSDFDLHCFNRMDGSVKAGNSSEVAKKIKSSYLVLCFTNA